MRAAEQWEQFRFVKQLNAYASLVHVENSIMKHIKLNLQQPIHES